MGRPPNNGKGSLRSSSEDQPDAFKNPHWEMVSDMTFRNTNVEVDGKRFYNCEFINVTFSFHGKGPTEFLECRFGASLTLDTDHPVAMAYSKLSRVFTAVPGAHSRLVSVDAKGRDLPENFHITEIERDRRAEALATLPVHAEPKPPAEEDPKVYLDPLNSEFIARGYMAFRISNQGQRVNPAQAVSIQRITNVPSIVFDYIDRIDPAERMVIVPTVDGDHLVPHHDILPELRQAWKDAHERGELDSDEFPFTITIHYRDAKQIRFISHVSFKYSPLAEDDARRTALSAHRTEYPILRVTNTHIRRLS